MDSRFETMDCHASTSALARNDGKRGFFTQDSRDCGGVVDFHRLQRILGFSKETSLRLFCDDFVRCEKKHKGVTSSGNDRRAFLTLAQKRAKAESTSETKTESIKGVEK